LTKICFDCQLSAEVTIVIREHELYEQALLECCAGIAGNDVNDGLLVKICNINRC
jgi:hypothetical protein